LNEGLLIDWVRNAAGAGGGVCLGIGDDAAVVRSRGRYWILKADMIAEGTHFSRRDSRPEDWGRKAVMVNASDIAAMGARPRYVLVSLGVPRRFATADARKIMRGALEASTRIGARIVGGDTCRCGTLVVSVMMAAEAPSGKWVTRSGARPGDAVLVTGPLGGSLPSGHHLRFFPRIGEGLFLAGHYRVHAMADVSDGLAADLRHLARAGGVGFEIYEDRLPLRRPARGARSAFLDGEDFELVFCLESRQARRLLRDGRAAKRGFKFYPIGHVIKKGLRFVRRNGKIEKFPAMPDHHFGA